MAAVAALAGLAIVALYWFQVVRVLDALSIAPAAARAAAWTLAGSLAAIVAFTLAMGGFGLRVVLRGRERALANGRPGNTDQPQQPASRLASQDAWEGAGSHTAPSRSVDMSQDADRERFVIRVLADVDRAILSHAPLDTVIDVILQAVPQATGCDAAAVTVIDGALRDEGRTIVRPADSHAEPAVHVGAAVDRAALLMLAQDPDGCSIDAQAAPAFLEPLASLTRGRMLLLPVFVDAKLAAVLAAGYPAGAEPDATARTLARAFADRLGVALTTSARDRALHRETNYDPVTALANQRLLRERLAQEISRSQRENRELALLYLDLDRFRSVNESVGHLEGDAVLQEASSRIKRCLRQEDVVSRFSGDEFVVLLPSPTQGADARNVAGKLIEALSRPFAGAGVEHHLGASIGISVFPQDGRSADKLLGNANFAMYRAKAAGRGRCVFYDERMNAQAVERAVLERDLRVALSNGELHLAYQPQVDLRDGRIIGAEALARWNHPRLGPIPPSVFVEIVERNSLIGELDRVVRELACTQYQAWQARGLVLPRLSLNVSGLEILRGGLAGEIRTLLQAKGMRPYALELEITEGLMLESSQDVLATLRDLRELGVRLAIDDFGTGYSSLGYLRKLPFDVLKIDRSFVEDLGTDDGSEGVVNAILGVARSLGKKVIAEGVETEAQRAFLQAQGCDCAQGYLWSRPLLPDDFEKLVRNWPSADTMEHERAAA